MRLCGTTAHGAVASTSYSQNGQAGPAPRLGDRRGLPHQFATLGSAFSAPRHARQARHCPETRAALFDPPPFNPDKLSVQYLPGASASDTASLPRRRRYTLTHNDLTGCLQLSVGADYNADQLSGWYTRVFRDEVLAEWADPPPALAAASAQPHLPVLNVYCHVSGEELWPAPPVLRSFIFQREMKLVLDTIAYAERRLIAAHPSLASATVFVHLKSDMAALNKVVAWGALGDRSTWKKAGLGRGLWAELLSGMAGVLGTANSSSVSGGSGAALAEAQQQQQEQQQRQWQAPPPASQRRASTLAGRARGAVSAAMRRSPLAGPMPGGRPGSNVVAVAAQRADAVWGGGCDSADGLPPPVEAGLASSDAATSRRQP